MPRYYCDYCDTYLTHDSPSVRKQHNSGYKHKANVRTYYQQFEEQQTQSLVDQKVKEYLQSAQRPQLPILPPPMFAPGVRPPVLPLPVHMAPVFPPPMGPPGANPMGMQMNMMPRPPMMNPPPTGVATNGAAPFITHMMYQPNPSFPASSSSTPVAITNAQESSAYSQTSETDH